MVTCWRVKVTNDVISVVLSLNRCYFTCRKVDATGLIAQKNPRLYFYMLLVEQCQDSSVIASLLTL